jgi:hypothetical protein
LTGPPWIRTREFRSVDRDEQNSTTSKPHALSHGDTIRLWVEETGLGESDNQRLRPMKVVRECMYADYDPWSIPLTVDSPWSGQTSRDFRALEAKRARKARPDSSDGG